MKATTRTKIAAAAIPYIEKAMEAMAKVELVDFDILEEDVYDAMIDCLAGDFATRMAKYDLDEPELDYEVPA